MRERKIERERAVQEENKQRVLLLLLTMFKCEKSKRRIEKHEKKVLEVSDGRNILKNRLGVVSCCVTCNFTEFFHDLDMSLGLGNVAHK